MLCCSVTGIHSEASTYKLSESNCVHLFMYLIWGITKALTVIVFSLVIAVRYLMFYTVDTCYLYINNYLEFL